MKKVTTITGSSAQLIGTVVRPRYADAFYGQISIYGNFDSGSVSILYSPDGGTTKIALDNPLTGTAYAISANKTVSLNPLGSTSKNNDESLLYVQPTGASAALTAVLEDNR